MKSAVTLEINGHDKLNHIEFFNTQNEIIFSKDLDDFKYKIELDNFHKGLYIIRCNFSSGRTVYSKLSIVK